ncbi:MAG: DUF4097 domain-containing protein [FCB group bacterium]|nr:DUF4097 domain-containing protein [FCB group bacterium]
MRIFVKTVVILTLAAFLLSAGAMAGKRTLVRTFDKKDRIKVKTISGDLIVKKGESDEIRVEVINSYSPRDSFEPQMRESGKTLKLTERIYGSNSGSSSWIVSVPDGVEIDFSSASGDMTVSDLNGEFTGSTASGDYEFENCRGTWNLSTASGDIELDGCEGEFELSTASGDVDANNVVVGYESSFSTASGSVDVRLAKSSEYDLHLGSASGRAVLNYSGNPIKGTFEMVSRDRRGRISAPYDFDHEEKFRKWGERYVRKSFTKGTDAPLITIETASGKAALREG